MSKLEFNYWFVLIRAAGTFCVEPSPLQTTGEKCCQNEVRGTKFKFQVEGTIVVTGFYSVYFFKEKLQKKKIQHKIQPLTAKRSDGYRLH